MSYVDVLAVEVLDNPAKYTDDLRFKITFQCKQKTLEGCLPVKGSNFIQESTGSPA
jgi:hypothetical protein